MNSPDSALAVLLTGELRRNGVFPRSLGYLLAIAAHGNFTRAAEALCVTQPTLSQQIKQLEEALDTQLLDRRNRAVRLTEAGELYVEYARRALEELEAGKRALRDVKDLSRGSLCLGMTPVTEYLVASLLEKFCARYPGVLMSIMEMSQSNIESCLLDDRLEAGIAFTDTLSRGSRSIEIERHVLFSTTLKVTVGKGHPYGMQEKALNSDAVEREPLVLLNGNFALRHQFDLYCLEHKIRPRIVAETSSLGVILEMVRNNRVATVLPEVLARSESGLCPVTLCPELPHHAITLIWHKDAHKSSACAAFLEVARDHWAEYKFSRMLGR